VADATVSAACCKAREPTGSFVYTLSAMLKPDHPITAVRHAKPNTFEEFMQRCKRTARASTGIFSVPDSARLKRCRKDAGRIQSSEPAMQCAAPF
jgi:hypothetical protein